MPARSTPSPASDPATRPCGDIVLRDGRDEDAAGVISLIGSVWREYEGVVFDVDAELPELRAPASAFAARGGRFWVAECDGLIVGTIGMAPAGTDVELHRLYVARRMRRSGLATRLLALLEGEARRRSAPGIVLWTDSRFLDGQRFYRRNGFLRLPQQRALDDLSRSIELLYRKAL